MQRIFNSPVHVPVDADERLLFNYADDICFNGPEGDRACATDFWIYLDGNALVVWRILCGGR